MDPGCWLAASRCWIVRLIAWQAKKCAGTACQSGEVIEPYWPLAASAWGSIASPARLRFCHRPPLGIGHPNPGRVTRLCAHAFERRIRRSTPLAVNETLQLDARPSSTGMPRTLAWWAQTGTTAQIGNTPGQPLKPGSMGRPPPGYDVVLVDPDGKRVRQRRGRSASAWRTGRWPHGWTASTRSLPATATYSIRSASIGSTDDARCAGT